MNSKLTSIRRGDIGSARMQQILNELIAIAQRTGHVKVANKTVATLTKGTLVLIDGYDATLAAPTVVAADADSGGAQFVLSEDIATDAAGIAYSGGWVDGLDTSGASAVGSKAYLSTDAGGFTWTAPSGAGDFVQVVGVCAVKNATTGAIVFNFGPWSVVPTP